MTTAAAALAHVWTTIGCKFCERAKLVLREHQIPYRALDVQIHEQRYEEAVRTTGVPTVPLVYFGAHFLGGSSEVVEAAERGELRALFDQHGASEPPDFLLPLSDAEAAKEAAMLHERQLEADVLRHAMQDYQVRVPLPSATDSSSSSSSSFIDFTFTELQNFLRGVSSSSATATAPAASVAGGGAAAEAAAAPGGGDNNTNNSDTAVCCSGAGEENNINRPLKIFDAGLFFKRRLVATGADLKAAVGQFLLSKSPQLEQQFTEAAARMLSAVLVSKLQMLYDTDNYALTDAQQQQVVASVRDDGLYRFMLDNAAAGDFSQTVLNGQRMLCSLQAAGQGPLVLSTTTATSGNALYQPTLPQIPDAGVTSRALWHAQEELLAKYRDPTDGLVDYARLRREENGGSSSSLLGRLNETSSLLQGVDLAAMSDKEKIACLINVYNACVYHGFAVWGLPHSTWQKVKFFGNVGYLIGGSGLDGAFFSLNDIENGLLRGNRKGVTDFFSNPMSEADPRRRLAVREVDCRIHAGLNCGSKSCPPVKVYTAANLDQELDAAMHAFVQSNTTYDAATKTLKVSTILKWYREDFQPSIQDVTLKYLAPEARDEILRSVGGNVAAINVEFADYDWSFAAKPE